MNTNFSSLSFLSSDTLYINNNEEIMKLKNDIWGWELRQDKYMKELESFKNISVDLNQKVIKEQCISGLRFCNQCIGQAEEEIKYLEEDNERWLLLEEIELSFW
jgi:hypothetical protein